MFLIFRSGIVLAMALALSSCAKVSETPAPPRQSKPDPGALSAPLKVCLAQYKGVISQGHNMLDIPITDLDNDADALNKIVAQLPLKKRSFTRSSVNSDSATNLEVKSEYKNLGDERSTTTSSELQVKVDAPKSPANLYLTLEFENDKTENQSDKLKQKFRVLDDCRLFLVEEERLTMEKTGEIVTLRKRTYVPSGETTDESKTFSKTVFEGHKTYSKLLESGKGAGDRFEFDTFIDFDWPVMHMVASPLSKISKTDPFTGVLTEFEQARIALTYKNRPFISLDIMLSPKSEWQRLTMQNVAAADVRVQTETVPEKAWRETDIGAGKLMTEVVVTGFKTADFAKLPLEIEINANKPWEYNNLAAYGTLVTEIKNPGQFRYVFRSGDIDLSKTNFDIDRNFYLRATKYYNFNAPEIQALVNEVNADGKVLSLRQRAEKALQVLNRHFKSDAGLLYDWNLIKHLPASALIKQKTGVCQHYATIYIALCRALGIPARMVTGYHIASLEAIPHGWVEISIEDRQWLPIEPQTVALKLPDQGYLPLSNQPSYETLANEDFDVTETSPSLNLIWQIKAR